MSNDEGMNPWDALHSVLRHGCHVFPRCWAAGEEVEITPDVVYRHKDGMALTYDVFRPNENANGLGVLFMVSGGGIPAGRRPSQGRLSSSRCSIAGSRCWRAMAQPRYKVPEAVADVRLAVRHIRLHAADYRIDPERLGVYGMSAGGHLSLALATTADAGDPAAKDQVLRQSSRVAAAVAYYPPSDLRAWVTGEDPKMRTDYPALQFEPNGRRCLAPPARHRTMRDAADPRRQGPACAIEHSPQSSARDGKGRCPAN